MKKCLYFLAILFLALQIKAQNVGIGTATPQMKLHIKGGLLLDSTNGSTPVSGAGTRLMWIPAKAAFRAGTVSGNQWDDFNIGNSSFASGSGSYAIGDYSTAMGIGSYAAGTASVALGYGSFANGNWSVSMGSSNTADGIYSIAMGSGTNASNDYSTAFGFNTKANGLYSTALGSSNIAAGNYATVIGYNTYAGNDYTTAMGKLTNATGLNATAMGFNTNAGGGYSTAMGYSTSASGLLSTSMGEFTKSKSYGGFVTGIFNDSTNAASSNTINSLNRIFQIGNGTADNARSNAMTVLQNGNTGIGTVNPNYMLTVKNDIDLDNSDANAGTTANTLRFGGGNTGEAIGSNRTTATNQFGLDFYTNSANRMSVTLGGNVGIGTTAPTAKLSVNGTANNATGNWGVFSDERVKTISGNFTDGLNVIRQINPVTFNYNDNAPFKTTDEQIGIVAQDLEKVAPYMVSKQHYQQFADLREVNNQAYVFLLINAVKEQQVQIDNQQKKMDALEKLVKALLLKVK